MSFEQRLWNSIKNQPGEYAQEDNSNQMEPV